MKDSLVYLDLIIDACDKIALFIADTNLGTFMEDKKTQSAVIMQLHVIGEEAKKVDDVMRAEIDLPWEKIIAQRNMISHEYFALELPLIWETATHDIPHLATMLREYLHSKGAAYMPPFQDTEPLL